MEFSRAQSPTAENRGTFVANLDTGSTVFLDLKLFFKSFKIGCLQ
jgi:hypothetical protein